MSSLFNKNSGATWEQTDDGMQPRFREKPVVASAAGTIAGGTVEPRPAPTVARTVIGAGGDVEPARPSATRPPPPRPAQAPASEAQSPARQIPAHEPYPQTITRAAMPEGRRAPSRPPAKPAAASATPTPAAASAPASTPQAAPAAAQPAQQRALTRRELEGVVRWYGGAKTPGEVPQTSPFVPNQRSWDNKVTYGEIVEEAKRQLGERFKVSRKDLNAMHERAQAEARRQEEEALRASVNPDRLEQLNNRRRRSFTIFGY